MPSFESIKEKIILGQRLNKNDAVSLFESSKVFEIGQLANLANYKKHKDVVYYNQNSHLNPTNVCVMSCKFCGFARKPGDDGAFAYTHEEILEKARKAYDGGAKELHMVGGLHPRWNFKYYTDMFSKIKEALPDVHIKALTAVEIDWLSKKSRKSIKDVLTELRDAGLDSMPGGGAEIFHPDCRDYITAKISTEDWIDVHRTAHNLGIKTNATMLYGHVESFEHRAYHLEQLRNLQDETSGFNCFIPLAFQPHNNELGIGRYTFASDDLKTLAVARLFLDNFKQVKSYWVMLGQEVAQMGLHFGANDIDGTVKDEKISLMAGGRSGRGLVNKGIQHLIAKAGKTHQERDTLYNALGDKQQRDEKCEHQRHADVLLQRRDESQLDQDEWIQIAQHAGFFELLQSSKRPKKQKISFCPAEIKLAEDLLEQKELEAPTYLDLGLQSIQTDQGASVNKLLQDLPTTNFSIGGFLSLWKVANHENIPVSKLFARLALNGIKLFSCSSHENEALLTHSEIVNLHQEAHKVGIQTVAKIELSSPPYGVTPFWKPFVERLLSFKESLGSNLAGIQIESAKDSWVTAHEYLRAVALTRSIFSEINIITPISALPVAKETGRGFFRGQEKLGSLCILAGADDWGIVPPSQDVHKRLCEEASSVNLKCYERDFLFQKNLLCNSNDSQLDLRHIPVANSQSILESM